MFNLLSLDRLCVLGLDDELVAAHEDLEFFRLEAGDFGTQHELVLLFLHRQAIRLELPRGFKRPRRKGAVKQGSELAAEEIKRSVLTPG